jgi:hypothetical protein
MTDQKKPRSFRVVRGGRKTSIAKQVKPDPRIPHLWPDYRALRGRGPGARDRLAKKKAEALLHIALEERLGVPIRCLVRDVEGELDKPWGCAFCEKNIVEGVCFAGPRGHICSGCMESGLNTLLDGEPWPKKNKHEKV